MRVALDEPLRQLVRVARPLDELPQQRQDQRVRQGVERHGPILDVYVYRVKRRPSRFHTRSGMTNTSRARSDASRSSE